MEQSDYKKLEQSLYDMRLTPHERSRRLQEAREKLTFAKFEKQLQTLITRFSGRQFSHNKLNPKKDTNYSASRTLEQWSKFKFPEGEKLVETEEKFGDGKPITTIGGLVNGELNRYNTSKVHYESLRDHLYKFINSV